MHTVSRALAFPPPDVENLEHSQANPLRLKLDWPVDQAIPAGLRLYAELHTSREVPAGTTPLVDWDFGPVADLGETPWTVQFTSEDMNRPVAPHASKAYYLVFFGVDAGNQLYTLSAINLVLNWHPVSRLTGATVSGLTQDLGGTAWRSGVTYAANTIVGRGGLAYICSAAHTSAAATEPGVGASWNTVWSVVVSPAPVTSVAGRTGAVTLTLTDIGGTTTIGRALAALANPGAVTFLRCNADNTVSALSANVFRVAIGVPDGTAVDQTLRWTGAAWAAAAAVVTVAGRTGAVTLGAADLSDFAAAARAQVEAMLGQGPNVTLTPAGSGATRTLTIAAVGGGSKTIDKWTARNGSPPATNFATLDTRGVTPVLVFDGGSTNEEWIFSGILQEGAVLTSGIHIDIEWMAATATSGQCRWGAQVANLSTQDADTLTFAAAVEANGTANATSGRRTRTRITLPVGNLDGLAPGDRYALRIYRDASDTGQDTMADFAQLAEVEIRTAN